MANPKFTFIDLFAGIGGFHQALNSLGGECVCASEISASSISLYKKNFPKTMIIGDIEKEHNLLPKFDVLTGGFPCQPFSKAGKQEGFEDKGRGGLFYTIIDILKKHKECKFVILENVKNLADDDNNWNIIKKELEASDFYFTDLPIVLSPTQFGIPQLRERVYILAVNKNIADTSKLTNGYIRKENLSTIKGLTKSKCKYGDANKILDAEYNESLLISVHESQILNYWLEFKNGTNFESPGVPIWLDYFGYNLSDEQYKNNLFDHLKKDKKDGVVKFVRQPSKIEDMPDWKRQFAEKNRKFYLKHKQFVDGWIQRTNILNENKIYKKIEWHFDHNVQDYRQAIIQFRQSGIRVKRNDYFPTLVAINNNPIIFDERNNVFRRLSMKEVAKLQSFREDFIIEESSSSFYKQIGNSVNVSVVKELFKELLKLAKDNWKDNENARQKNS